MIDEKIIEGLREYIKDNYFPPQGLSSAVFGISAVMAARITGPLERHSFRVTSDDVSKYVRENKSRDDFAHTLDSKRKEKGLTPAALYKRAGIDRRQYSRFMGPEHRHPSMNTAISFGLALRLNRQEFDGFLQAAGYTLNRSSSRDVCIMYCLEKGIYDVEEVNVLLFEIGNKPLSRE
jgi:hypothetical protein